MDAGPPVSCAATEEKNSVNSKVVAAFLCIKWEPGSGDEKEPAVFEYGHLQRGNG